MYQSAKAGKVFVLTQKGYEETPDRVKQEREVGQPLKGFEHSVPASWIKQGYVEEQADPRAVNKFVASSANGSVHDKLEKFQQEAKEKVDTDNSKQREDRQEER